MLEIASDVAPASPNRSACDYGSRRALAVHAWPGRRDAVFPSRLSLRQSLEGRHAFRDMVESLLVDGEDRHLRAAIETGIVERADFQDHRGQTRPPRR